MIGKQVVGEKPITLAEVRQLLEKNRKEGEAEELPFYQKPVYEYAKAFGKTGVKKAQEAFEKLSELGLDAKTAVRIIDVKPETKEEVRLILEKTKIAAGPEKSKKILDIAADL